MMVRVWPNRPLGIRHAGLSSPGGMRHWKPSQPSERQMSHDAGTPRCSDRQPVQTGSCETATDGGVRRGLANAITVPEASLGQTPQECSVRWPTEGSR